MTLIKKSDAFLEALVLAHMLALEESPDEDRLSAMLDEGIATKRWSEEQVDDLQNWAMAPGPWTVGESK